MEDLSVFLSPTPCLPNRKARTKERMRAAADAYERQDSHARTSIRCQE